MAKFPPLPRMNRKGYSVIKVGVGHPVADKKGMALEHRMVWFCANGPIPDGFVVHHLNGDKTDNRIENLSLMSRSAHMKEHYAEGLGRRNGVKVFIDLECARCKKLFQRDSSESNWNKRHSGNANYLSACSRRCAANLANDYRHGRLKRALPEPSHD